MQGKVIVITGASSGIGAGLAAYVGSHGGKPLLTARRQKELLEATARSGPDAFAIVGDMTVRADVERVRDVALERFGRIDVWVNNAGRGISRLVSQLTDEDFDEMMSTNVKSVLYGMQAVLPHFRSEKRGHIINISSMLGRMPFAPIRSAYAAAKHAMNSLSANLRMELSGEFPDVHVSVVHPGVVATDFGLNAKHGGPDSRQLPNSQTVDEVVQVIADVINKPRADIYTRDGAQQWVVNYYAAPDMGEAEKRPPFVMVRK